MIECVNHSGGCPGSDMMWENEGYKYGIKTIAYSFSGHSHDSKNPKILTQEELAEGFANVEIANKTLKRSIYRLPSYVKSLLSRNWFQVKNADAVYAIGTFVNKDNKLVNGGTGWAVQMGIDNKKPVYVFEQDRNCWYEFKYDVQKFEEYKEQIPIPMIVGNFAGIGTREINENGKMAIEKIYSYSFVRNAGVASEATALVS